MGSYELSLMSYLLEDFYQKFAKNLEESSYKNLFFAEEAPESCALNRHVRKNYRNTKLIAKELTKPNIKTSMAFKKTLSKHALNFSPKKYSQQVVDIISSTSYIKEKKMKKWLGFDAVTLFNKKIKSYTRRKQCTSALEYIKKHITSDKKLRVDSDVVSASAKVDSCFLKFSNKKPDYTFNYLSYFIKDKFGTEVQNTYELGLIKNFIKEKRYQKASFYIEHNIKKSNEKKLKNFVLKLNMLKTKLFKAQELNDLALANNIKIIGEHGFSKLSTPVFKEVILFYLTNKKYVEVIKTSSPVLVNSKKENKQIRQFAYFWRAVAYFNLGNISKAKNIFKTLYSENALSYYGVLSRYFVKSKDSLTFFAHTDKLLPTKKIFVDNKNVKTKNKINLVKALLRLNKTADASCEMRYFNHHRISNNKDLLEVSLLSYATGDWLLSVKSLLKLYDRLGTGGFHKDLLYILFPIKYSELVDKFSTKTSLDAYIIYSLIRQESVFNKRARSIAGARGVMQLMPRTARGEVRNMSSKYVSNTLKKKYKKRLRFKNSLFDPDLNITIGVHYLDRIYKKVDNLIWAIASYNAGPHKIKTWQKELKDENIFITIENIPYKETRNYVKFIMRNYFYYKELYSDKTVKKEQITTIIKNTVRNF